jgi:pimeloyl-ACP methyl ester carboxylesterase
VNRPEIILPYTAVLSRLMTAVMGSTIAIVLVLALAVVGALVEFSVLAARRIERAVPPQGRFLALGGEKIHIFEKGSGPPVVLIHGLEGQMGNFTHSLVDRLAGDFRVVAIDRPGSGYSTRSPGRPAGVRAQAAALAGAIRELKLGRCVIVGHSFGGAVALAIALDEPDCASALALIAPVTHPMAAPPLVLHGLAMRSPLLRRSVAWTLATPVALLARGLAFKQFFAPEPVPADFATAGGGLLGMRPRNVYAASSDMVAMNEDVEAMTPRYASIRIPVGILYGRGDRILDPRAQGETMKALIPALDLEFMEGGHMLPVTAPDAVAAFIRRVAVQAWAHA